MFITTAGGQCPIWLYLTLQEKEEALKMKAAYQLGRSLDYVGHLRWTVGSSKYSEIFRNTMVSEAYFSKNSK